MIPDSLASYFSNQTLLTIILASFITWGVYFVFQPALSQKETHLDNDLVIEEEISIQQQQPFKDSCNEHLLSLIIPAYNEELRLPPMLLSTIGHLKTSKDEIVGLCNDIIIHDPNESSFNSVPFEIVIVNDGSKDTTIDAVINILKKNFSNNKNLNDLLSIRLLTLKQNCGKGAAVKVGMLHSKGRICLMVDADDATNFQPSLIKLLQEMKTMKKNNKVQPISSNNYEHGLIVFGSRAHLQEDSKAKRSFVRTILMVAFHFFVKTLCSTMIHDTQCGFKLFTKDAAKVLFQNLHLTQWAFDTELVVIAERIGIPIAEVGVEWKEVGGSKLATSKMALLISSVEMLRDMLCVKIMYTVGLWRLKTSCN